MTFLWIYLLLTVLVNWIIDKMKPHYRQQLQEEHDRIINYLKTMQE